VSSLAVADNAEIVASASTVFLTYVLMTTETLYVLAHMVVNHYHMRKYRQLLVTG